MILDVYDMGKRQGKKDLLDYLPEITIVRKSVIQGTERKRTNETMIVSGNIVRASQI